MIYYSTVVWPVHAQAEGDASPSAGDDLSFPVSYTCLAGKELDGNKNGNYRDFVGVM